MLLTVSVPISFWSCVYSTTKSLAKHKPSNLLFQFYPISSPNFVTLKANIKIILKFKIALPLGH